MRPTPSSGTQRMSDVSTPPWRTRSSTSRPDVVVDERRHDGGAQPEAAAQAARDVVLPPPSQTRNERAVRIRPSPGSRRSMTSPSETRSKRHSPRGGGRGRSRRAPAALATASAARRCDRVEVARRDELGRNHPAPTDGDDAGQAQDRRPHSSRLTPPVGTKRTSGKRRCERLQQVATPTRLRGKELEESSPARSPRSRRSPSRHRESPARRAPTATDDRPLKPRGDHEPCPAATAAST